MFPLHCSQLTRMLKIAATPSTKTKLQAAFTSTLLLTLFSVSLFGKPGDATALQTIPEWEGMDIVDRHYAGTVECTFEASIDGFIHGALPQGNGNLKQGTGNTIGEALHSGCNACLDHLTELQTPSRRRRYVQQPLCVLQGCKTVRARNIVVEPWVFWQGMTGFKRADSQTCATRTPPPYVANRYQQTYANYYSRPNDDFFQNSKGDVSHGEPYEVAIVRAAIIGTTDLLKRTVDLEFEFKAEVTTGRNVEPGLDYILHEESNSIPGEKPLSEKGKELSEKLGEVKRVAYPPGANIDSNFEKKMGSMLVTKIHLGKIAKDGTYSGQVTLRQKRFPEPGDEVLPNDPPWKLGNAAKRADWSATIRQGRIADVKLTMVRTYEPGIRFVQSNFQTVDRNLPKHKHFHQQERRQICGSEKIGYGPKPVETPEEALALKVGKMILKSGCMDCHDEGKSENFRFCDETGMPAYPESDAPFILAAITEGLEKTNPNKRYSGAMRDGMKTLKELNEKEGNLIQQWVELQAKGTPKAQPPQTPDTKN